jgi:hypothetical protein
MQQSSPHFHSCNENTPTSTHHLSPPSLRSEVLPPGAQWPAGLRAPWGGMDSGLPTTRLAWRLEEDWSSRPDGQRRGRETCLDSPIHWRGRCITRLEPRGPVGRNTCNFLCN